MIPENIQRLCNIMIECGIDAEISVGRQYIIIVCNNIQDGHAGELEICFHHDGTLAT